jgi:3-hydroxyisobutyrate dehydrogenase
MNQTIGFIGLGIMGSPMAARLMGGSNPLWVYSRTRSRANPLISRGARWADSPAKMAAECDVIFLCVTDTPDVQAVIAGEQGILSGSKRGLIVVDHSTISPAATRQLAEDMAARGVKLLDAPVSGGETGAKNGTLSIMVGGDADAFDRVEPLLKKMGTTITHCGKSGNGQLTKLVNQILVSVNNLAVCEALTFAKTNKLDLEKTLAAISGGGAASWILSNLGPKMAKGDMRPGFMINLQQKDLRLVLTAAEDSRTSLPTTSLAHQLFTAAQAAGHGKDGTQALFTVVEKLASVH